MNNFVLFALVVLVALQTVSCKSLIHKSRKGNDHRALSQTTHRVVRRLIKRQVEVGQENPTQESSPSISPPRPYRVLHRGSSSSSSSNSHRSTLLGDDSGTASSTYKFPDKIRYALLNDPASTRPPTRAPTTTSKPSRNRGHSSNGQSYYSSRQQQTYSSPAQPSMTNQRNYYSGYSQPQQYSGYQSGYQSNYNSYPSSGYTYQGSQASSSYGYPYSSQQNYNSYNPSASAGTGQNYGRLGNDYSSSSRYGYASSGSMSEASQPSMTGGSTYEASQDDPSTSYSGSDIRIGSSSTRYDSSQVQSVGRTASTETVYPSRSSLNSYQYPQGVHSQSNQYTGQQNDYKYNPYNQAYPNYGATGSYIYGRNGQAPSYSSNSDGQFNLYSPTLSGYGSNYYGQQLPSSGYTSNGLGTSSGSYYGSASSGSQYQSPSSVSRQSYGNSGSSSRNSYGGSSYYPNSFSNRNHRNDYSNNYPYQSSSMSSGSANARGFYRNSNSDRSQSQYGSMPSRYSQSSSSPSSDSSYRGFGRTTNFGSSVSERPYENSGTSYDSSSAFGESRGTAYTNPGRSYENSRNLNVGSDLSLETLQDRSGSGYSNSETSYKTGATLGSTNGASRSSYDSSQDTNGASFSTSGASYGGGTGELNGNSNSFSTGSRIVSGVSGTLYGSSRENMEGLYGTSGTSYGETSNSYETNGIPYGTSGIPHRSSSNLYGTSGRINAGAGTTNGASGSSYDNSQEINGRAYSTSGNPYGAASNSYATSGGLPVSTGSTNEAPESSYDGSQGTSGEAYGSRGRPYGGVSGSYSSSSGFRVGAGTTKGASRFSYSNSQHTNDLVYDPSGIPFGGASNSYGSSGGLSNGASYGSSQETNSEAYGTNRISYPGASDSHVTSGSLTVGTGITGNGEYGLPYSSSQAINGKAHETTGIFNGGGSSSYSTSVGLSDTSSGTSQSESGEGYNTYGTSQDVSIESHDTFRLSGGLNGGSGGIYDSYGAASNSNENSNSQQNTNRVSNNFRENSDLSQSGSIGSYNVGRGRTNSLYGVGNQTSPSFSSILYKTSNDRRTSMSSQSSDETGRNYFRPSNEHHSSDGVLGSYLTSNSPAVAGTYYESGPSSSQWQGTSSEQRQASIASNEDSVGNFNASVSSESFVYHPSIVLHKDNSSSTNNDYASSFVSRIMSNSNVSVIGTRHNSGTYSTASSRNSNNVAHSEQDVTQYTGPGSTFSDRGSPYDSLPIGASNRIYLSGHVLRHQTETENSSNRQVEQTQERNATENHQSSSNHNNRDGGNSHQVVRNQNIERQPISSSNRYYGRGSASTYNAYRPSFPPSVGGRQVYNLPSRSRGRQLAESSYTGEHHGSRISSTQDGNTNNDEVASPSDPGNLNYQAGYDDNASDDYNHEYNNNEVASNGQTTISVNRNDNQHSLHVHTEELPDIEIDLRKLTTNFMLDRKSLSSLLCARGEGCLSSSADNPRRTRGHSRKLLRFQTTVRNIGTAPFLPFLDKSDWLWHQCHNHSHSMAVFTHYDLYNETGHKVAEGHKASFCLEDSSCRSGVQKVYNCDRGHQGISPGCEDTYKASIDCQWIDVTDVHQGDYIFKVLVNPNRLVRESSFANNGIECQVRIRRFEANIWNCRVIEV